MLSAAFTVQLLVMIGGPIVFCVALVRRWKVSAVLVGAGALAWIGSQVVHMPLNQLLTALGAIRPIGDDAPSWALPLNAALLGLTAGLCEGMARWLMLRFALREARTHRAGLVFGAGHGGFEAFWFGVLAGATLLANWATSRAGAGAMGLEAAQAVELAGQLDTYWSMPWFLPLLGAAERVMTVCFHMTASALVMLAVVRGRLWPLVAAIVWHALADALTVYTVATYGIVVTELVILAWMPVCALVIWATGRALAAAE